MSIATIREDLASACATVPGLKGSAYKRDQVNPPLAEVTTGVWDPRDVLGEGSTTRDFIVTLYGGRIAEDQSQKLLDGYVEMSGATSVIAAVQADGALSTADYATVTNVGELLVVPVGAVEYLAIRLTVEVCF